MKLITWNVNGIRACQKKGFLEFLETEKPDVLGIQEIKCYPHQLDQELLEPPTGHEAWYCPAERAGYSGTGLFSLVEPKEVRKGFPDDNDNEEGRVITAIYEKYVFITTYIPNGKDDMSRIDYKIQYSQRILDHAKELMKEFPGLPVVICGDVNTAHTEIDLARPNDNKNSNGFSPPERAWVDHLVSEGFVDAFRHCHPEKTDTYSWWSYRAASRERNVGWRIDYFFVNEEAKDLIKDCYYLVNQHGSDHCPVVLELDV